MKGILDRIPKKFRDIITLVFGNSLSAFIPILISPLLTRFYDDNAFGLLTLFLSYVLIITSFSTGRYHMAILEAESEEESSHLAILSLLISLLVTILVLGLVFVSLFFELVKIKLLDDLGMYSYLIPAGILFISIFQITQSILNRYKLYTPLANTKIVKSTGVSILQLINVTPFGLIFGKVIGELIGTVYSYFEIKKRRIESEITFSVTKFKYVAIKYSKYVKANSLHSAITAISTNLPPIILAIYYSTEVIGNYGLSLRVCILPVLLISQAFFQVFSREIVIRIQEGNAPYDYFLSNTYQLIKIGAAPFLILFLFGPDLFRIVFGDIWGLSGVYARLLTPYLFSKFIVSPFAFVPVMRNYHYEALYIEIFGLILKLGFLFIGAHFLNDIYAIGMFSITSTVINFGLYFWIRNIVKNISEEK